MPLTTVTMWSEAAQAVVDWDVSTQEQTDEGGNVHAFIAIQHGDEIHRLSPSHSDAEVLQRVDEMNRSAIEAHIAQHGTAAILQRLAGA